ncbi:MAG: hypothetical protein BroJett018_52990 [Chloroflexota bacterium]|nr:MAG: hypothetical protein BroJett018_52990 [Chloroflexota bacterium]
MSALDACKPQIIRALEKDGWQIVEKPHQIGFNDRMAYADFSARHVNEDDEQFIIVMEVKCFTNPKADLTELYTAIGQYQFYIAAMRSNREEFPLYLAIPTTAYLRFLEATVLLDAFQIARVKLVVVDISQEVVERWIH